MALNPATSQHLLDVHRKSFIGRLERSSFQDQRLSDVGVAFGQQITARVGLKLPASQERIIEQTRWLYLRYVFLKLRQNALPLRDLNLTKSSRQRRAACLGGTDIVADGSQPGSPNISVPLIRLPSQTSFSDKRRHRDHHLLSAPTQPTTGLINGSRPSIINARNSINSSIGGAPIPGYTGSGSSSAGGGGGGGANSRKYVMDPTINGQIFNVIWSIIIELRDVKPEFFGDTIYEHIGLDKFSSLQNLLNVQLTICQEMIRSDISWCRIAALFSLFGAMSLDCVRLGAPEHVGPILDGFIEFVERDLSLWISQQGGWESFLYTFTSGNSLRRFASNLVILVVPLTAVLLCFQCIDII